MRRARTILPSALVGVCLLAGSSGCRSEASQPPSSAGHSTLDQRISEPSGLVRSRTHPGVFWTHGDSGCGAAIHAVGGDGKLIRSFPVEGGSCIDWEDIAVDDAGYLYLADTGNNTNERRDLAVHRLVEPDPANGAGSVEIERTYRFRYADQKGFPDPADVSYDAEALFWAKGGLYLLTKHRGDMRTKLYRIPEEAAQREVALAPLGSFFVGGDKARYGGMVTGADVTPDGRYLAVLTYHALFLFERPESGDQYLSRPVNRIDLNQHEMQQTESIAWDGWSLLVGNEDRKLFRLDNPFEKRTNRFP